MSDKATIDISTIQILPEFISREQEGELPTPKGRWASCFNEGHWTFVL
jgi:hypothetical protein